MTSRKALDAWARDRDAKTGFTPLKWTSRYEPPFWAKKTYRTSATDYIRLTWDGGWQVRVGTGDIQHCLREFHYLEDAKFWASKWLTVVRHKTLELPCPEQLNGPCVVIHEPY